MSNREWRASTVPNTGAHRLVGERGAALRQDSSRRTKGIAPSGCAETANRLQDLHPDCAYRVQIRHAIDQPSAVFDVCPIDSSTARAAAPPTATSALTANVGPAKDPRGREASHLSAVYSVGGLVVDRFLWTELLLQSRRGNQDMARLLLTLPGLSEPSPLVRRHIAKKVLYANLYDVPTLHTAHILRSYPHFCPDRL